MTPEHAYAFLAFAVVAAITPGPSNVMLAAAGALAGIRGGLPCLFGVAAGMGVMLFAVTFGLGALVLAHPVVVGAMRWCGAAFLLWLAWCIATARDDARAAAPRTPGFLGAAAFQWLNPKAWLVAASAAGTYLEPAADAVAQALALAGLFCAAALPCGFAWLAAGVVMRRMPYLNVAMGVLLTASVVFMLR